jgi:EAL and modified HD-GYP domain-containing signal transduction protein
LTEVFLARQPILDRNRSVAAYELLYRDGDVDAARVDDEEAATARVALSVLTELGLDRVVGDGQAWINVSPDFIRDELVFSLPKNRVALEIRAEELDDPGLLELVAELRRAGYGVALDDFRLTAENERLLASVDTVKLDLAALGAEEFAREAQRLKPHDIKVVAQKVETPEDFEHAVNVGCDLFQGYFFFHPEVVKDRAVAPNRLALLRLAASLQDPNLELADLERLISSDVVLSYRLLRYINSAYFGLRQQVASLMHAVSLLGVQNVRRWATLTTFAAVEDKPNELFVTALIRARFCQEAGADRDGPAPERFTLGLFSVVDALTDMPMKDVVKDLPFPQRLCDALVNHSGSGRLITCLQAIEQGNFGRAARELDHAARHYTSALGWANEVAKELKDTAAAEVPTEVEPPPPTPQQPPADSHQWY